jgi:hypothetical protein
MYLSFFLKRMVIEILFNIQMFLWINMSLHFQKEKNINVCMIGKRLKMSFQFCHLNKTLITYQIRKLTFVQHLKQNMD